MIDDEIDRHQRIDFGWISAKMLHSVAHGGEIDHRRDAGEVLHQDPRRAERDLAIRRPILKPLRDRLNVLFDHRAAILVTQQVFQKHLERERQSGNSFQPVFLGRRQAEIGIGLGADLQQPEAFEAIDEIHDLFPFCRLRRTQCRGNLRSRRA